jgi:hypothetical protein
MAHALILEFDGYERSHYEAVNERLGLDPVTGEGDWPEGLLSHTGALKSGGLAVFEVWESQEAQQRFMEERLGQALQEGGVAGPPARAEWMEVMAEHTP